MTTWDEAVRAGITWLYGLTRWDDPRCVNPVPCVLELSKEEWRAFATREPHPLALRDGPGVHGGYMSFEVVRVSDVTVESQCEGDDLHVVLPGHSAGFGMNLEDVDYMGKLFRQDLFDPFLPQNVARFQANIEDGDISCPRDFECYLEYNFYSMEAVRQLRRALHRGAADLLRAYAAGEGSKVFYGSTARLIDGNGLRLLNPPSLAELYRGIDAHLESMFHGLGDEYCLGAFGP